MNKEITFTQMLNINNKGNKWSKLIAFIAFAPIAFFVFPPTSVIAQESTSVGVVNVTFLMENAPQSDLASNLLKEKFLPQEKKLAEELEEINNLEAELKKIIAQKNLNTDVKRQKERELRSKKRARNRSLQDFREELRFARDTALDDVQKEVFSAINEVRKKQKIDIVLQDYISADERVDITPKVLEYLKGKINKQAETPSDNKESTPPPSEETNKSQGGKSD